MSSFHCKEGIPTSYDAFINFYSIFITKYYTTYGLSTSSDNSFLQ